METMENEITLEDFDKYHTTVGEDFCDQHSNIIDHKILGGYLICAFPEIASELLKELNSKYCDANALRNVFVDYMCDGEGDIFYTAFARFINLTTYLKANVQKIFTEEDEYYNS